jgi:Tfp pilus assembly protein PilV
MKYFSKISKYFTKSQSGFLMVEVVIVTSIIVVAVLAFMAVAQKSIYLSRQSLHTAQAVFLLEEGAEATRIVRDNDWSTITGLTAGSTYSPTFSSNTWTLSPTQNMVGIFTRTVSIANVSRDATSNDIVTSGGTNDTGTKLVTVTVSWPEGGTTITKTLSFYISDLF